MFIYILCAYLIIYWVSKFDLNQYFMWREPGYIQNAGFYLSSNADHWSQWEIPSYLGYHRMIKKSLFYF